MCVYIHFHILTESRKYICLVLCCCKNKFPWYFARGQCEDGFVRGGNHTAFQNSENSDEMLRDRGYVVGDFEIEMTKYQFLQKYGENMKREDLVINKKPAK